MDTEREALARRLEAGETGPAIDALILAALEGREVVRDDAGRLLARNRRPPHDAYQLLDEHGRPAPMKPPLPRYSTSLDAARALVRGLWSLFCEDGPTRARILLPRTDGSFLGQRYSEARAERPTAPPAAILTAAALRAGAPSVRE